MFVVAPYIYCISLHAVHCLKLHGFELNFQGELY